MLGATTKHQISLDARVTYIQSAKIKDLSMPEESATVTEESFLDDASGFKDFISSQVDPGELGLTLKWNKGEAAQTALDAAAESTTESGRTILGKITFADASNYIYTGVISGRGLTVTKEDTVTRSYTIKITGKPIISDDSVPTATAVIFSGTLQVGQLLTGSYTYTDVDSDVETTTTFRWYASDDAGGTGKAEIVGAASSTYTLTSSELGKFISFEVTPVNFNATGVPVESAINSTAVIA